MNELIKVIYRTERIGYVSNPKYYNIEPDEKVIIKVERGEDICRVINCSIDSEEVETNEKICKIIRIASEEDIKNLHVVKQKEDEAIEKFQEIMEKYPFNMKPLEAVYQFDGNKLIFFFTAEGRIDFREFVRDLAIEFKTRIELHQSSGREDAKRYSGLGICGRPYCCTSYLKKFNQVTIKMVKDQNLLNNLSKITGPCGRLLCCLLYEEKFYLEKANLFPKNNEEIIYKNQKMQVYKNDYFKNEVYLISKDKNRQVIDLKEFKRLKKDFITLKIKEKL